MRRPPGFAIHPHAYLTTHNAGPISASSSLSKSLLWIHSWGCAMLISEDLWWLFFAIRASSLGMWVRTTLATPVKRIFRCSLSTCCCNDRALILHQCYNYVPDTRKLSSRSNPQACSALLVHLAVLPCADFRLVILLGHKAKGQATLPVSILL